MCLVLPEAWSVFGHNHDHVSRIQKNGTSSATTAQDGHSVFHAGPDMKLRPGIASPAEHHLNHLGDIDTDSS
jgi:hypothetical protein